jgi:hypothetical protein
VNAQELTILLESPANFGKIIKGRSAVSLGDVYIYPLIEKHPAKLG